MVLLPCDTSCILSAVEVYVHVVALLLGFDAIFILFPVVCVAVMLSG